MWGQDGQARKVAEDDEHEEVPTYPLSFLGSTSISRTVVP